MLVEEEKEEEGTEAISPLLVAVAKLTRDELEQQLAQQHQQVLEYRAAIERLRKQRAAIKDKQRVGDLQLHGFAK